MATKKGKRRRRLIIDDSPLTEAGKKVEAEIIAFRKRRDAQRKKASI
jgi:hypothetical protein